MTDAERFVWAKLRNRRFAGYKVCRQQPIGPYIVDFICRQANLIIEIDGGQHARIVAADEERTRFLEAEGFRVVRFWNNQIFREWDGVEQVILRMLNEGVGWKPPQE